MSREWSRNDADNESLGPRQVAGCTIDMQSDACDLDIPALLASCLSQQTAGVIKDARQGQW